MSLHLKSTRSVTTTHHAFTNDEGREVHVIIQHVDGETPDATAFVEKPESLGDDLVLMREALRRVCSRSDAGSTQRMETRNLTFYRLATTNGYDVVHTEGAEESSLPLEKVMLKSTKTGASALVVRCTSAEMRLLQREIYT